MWPPVACAPGDAQEHEALGRVRFRPAFSCKENCPRNARLETDLLGTSSEKTGISRIVGTESPGRRETPGLNSGRASNPQLGHIQIRQPSLGGPAPRLAVGSFTPISTTYVQHQMDGVNAEFLRSARASLIDGERSALQLLAA